MSPTKGIYKCFGCGKGGNSVNFVMEIGGLSIQKLQKELAFKIQYWDWRELTPDQIDKENKRDGIYLISSYKQIFSRTTLGNRGRQNNWIKLF